MLLYYSGGHGCLRILAGGGALYIQRAKQHARRIHPDSFYVDDSVRRRLYRRIKKHLAIDLLAQKLSRTPALVLDSIIQVIITVFALIFMVYGGDIIVEKAAHVSQMSPVLKWPMDKVYWVMPISGVILVYYTIVNVIDNYHQRHLR